VVKLCACVPADSFPITKVIGDRFWMEVLRVTLAAERKTERDVRGSTIALDASSRSEREEIVSSE